MAPKLEHSVTDTGKGTHLLMLTAVQEGLHVMTVHLAGQEVIGSPLTLHIEKPPVLASTKVAGKSRGDILFAVASAMANSGINWAYRMWEGFLDARMEQMDCIRAAFYTLVNVDVRWSFNTWSEKTRETQWIKSVINKARGIHHQGRATLLLTVNACFAKWKATRVVRTTSPEPSPEELDVVPVD